MVEKVKSSQITPEEIYLSRRRFIGLAGAALAGGIILDACVGILGNKTAPSSAASTPASTPPAGQVTPTLSTASGLTDELGDPATSYDAVTNYNNYYEYTPIKQDVAGLSKSLVTSPWQVKVGGLVHNPKTYDVSDLKRKFSLEERIYRLRCVEAWSMVIPWTGFSLAGLLKEVDPMTSANFVRFEALLKPEEMPGQNRKTYPWPYVEALNLDEAMHPLTILATGLYGKDLLPQNGAPIRLVVPWKYGFKSIKAIVKIDLVEAKPATFWTIAAPDEYGFYANVNPDVPHPRWSQKTERRIGVEARMKTSFLNGYAQSVDSLYSGLDLKTNF